MSGGAFTLTGGFWVLPQGVQMTYAPLLIIAAAAPGYALISWTPATPGFVLQGAAGLSPTNWVNAPTGPTNPAVVPATFPARFYRLRQP